MVVRQRPAKLVFSSHTTILCPPLRQWLTRKKRETRRGRAELELAGITALWKDRPESRRLPSPFEWLKIVCFTRARSWSVDERRMMRSATRRVLFRATAMLIFVGAVGYVISATRDHERARAALESALKADYENLPRLLPEVAASGSAAA